MTAKCFHLVDFIFVCITLYDEIIQFTINKNEDKLTIISSNKDGWIMNYKINTMVMENEFKICPICGYKDGFHTMLKKDKDNMKWLFICPSCHEIFDIGYTIKNVDIK
jgi:hypothetical protein